MKNFKRFGILFCVAIILPPVFAQADGTVGSHAAEVIKSILERRLVVLDRSVVTFHYESGGALSEFKPKWLADVQRHVLDWPQRFYDPSITASGLQGPGTYVAVDPVSSRSYGGSVDPLLFVLTIAKGTRMVNLLGTGLDEIEIDQLRQVDTDLGCEIFGRPGGYVGNFSDSWIGAFRQSQSQACRLSLIQAFQALRIAAIAYEWSDLDHSDGSRLNGCRSKRDIAFNVVNPEAVVKKSIALYARRYSWGDLSARMMIARLYDEANESGDDRSLTKLTFLSGIKISLKRYLEEFYFGRSTMEKRYITWKETNIYACGPRWQFETGRFEPR